jgi:hypothetical protein
MGFAPLSTASSCTRSSCFAASETDLSALSAAISPLPTAQFRPRTQKETPPRGRDGAFALSDGRGSGGADQPVPARPSADGTPAHRGGACSWIVASLTSWTPKLKQMGVHETGSTSVRNEFPSPHEPSPKPDDETSKEAVVRHSKLEHPTSGLGHKARITAPRHRCPLHPELRTH